MTVTVTPVDHGTVPGDDAGESAFSSFEKINTNEANFKSAIEGLQGRFWTIQNSSTTLALGGRYVADNHAGITLTAPATFAISATNYSDVWVCNADDASNITLAPASGDAFFVDGATLGVDTTKALAPGELAFLIPRTTDSEWNLYITGGTGGGGWANMTEAVWAGGTQSEVADGASAVAFDYDTDNAYSTAGAKLASWKNATVEKAYIDKDGNIRGNVIFLSGAYIVNTVTTASTRVSGGDNFNTGANYQLFGQSHASTPYDILFKTNSNLELHFDYSEDYWHFQNNEIRSSVGLYSSGVADGASAEAFKLNTTNTYSTAGANLLCIKNNGTNVFDFSFQGGIDHVNSGASTAAHSQSLNLNWASSAGSTSSGQYSAVIGNYCRASGNQSFAIGNYASAQANDSIAFGKQSTVGANGNYSAIFGYQGTIANQATIGLAGGWFAAGGDAITTTATLKAATTDATQTTMQANATNYVIPADTAWAFSALVSARSDEADGNNCAAWELKGLIKRDELNNTAIVGVVSITDIAADTDAIPWDVDAVADDTNEALAIRVTGEAATNIRWVAKLDISQVGYA